MKRQCGNCQLCCELIAVEPLGKPDNVKCPHQRTRGCGIYADRPEACKAFTCGWLVGALPKSCRPERTGVVVWTTNFTSTGGLNLEHIQANMAPGHKIPQRLWNWLVDASHNVAVILSEGEGERTRLLQDGRVQATWNERDFFVAEPKRQPNGLAKLKFKEIRKREDVLVTDADRENWERVQRESITVEETDDRYRH